jgi:hypothetical protein
MGRAAADENRCALGAMTSAAGALLFVELATGRADFRPCLGRSSALAMARKLGLENIIEEALVDRGIEDAVGEIHLTDALLTQVVDLHLWHGPTALRLDLDIDAR